MLKSSFTAATFLVAVFLWPQLAFGQGLSAMSSHQGQIKNVLVLTDANDFYWLLNHRDPRINFLRDLLCSLDSLEISSCLVFRKQIIVCNPVDELKKKMNELKRSQKSQFVGDSMFQAKMDSITAINRKIRSLERKISKTAGFDKIDFNSIYWSKDSSGLKTEQIQFFRLVEEWYEIYLRIQDFGFEQSLNRLDSQNVFCKLDMRPGNFSLIKNCRNEMNPTETKVGGEFSQDEFITYSDSNSFIIRPRLTTAIREGDLLSRMGQGGCNIRIDSALKADVQGGNMLVTGNFALVGMDVLKEWYSLHKDISKEDRFFVLQRLNALELDSNATEEEITTCLEDDLGKTIIWIGDTIPYFNYFGDSTSNLSYPGYGYQPLWHIDLFLHPISYRSSSIGDSVTFLVGIPDEKWQNHPFITEEQEKKRKAIIDSVRTRINQSISKLISDLNQHKVHCDTVHIPLPLAFFGPSGATYVYDYIKDYFSFCNGLYHENGPSVFISPEWSDNFLSTFYANPSVVGSVKVGLERRCIEYRGISGPFGTYGAVHCKVLVTERSK